MTVLSPTETDNQLHGADPQVRCYSSHFEDSMQMLAPQAVVARYLDGHQSWFERCASPMQVEAIDRQSYSLTLGRFGNCLLYTSPSPRDRSLSRMPSSA